MAPKRDPVDRRPALILLLLLAGIAFAALFADFQPSTPLASQIQRVARGGLLAVVLSLAVWCLLRLRLVPLRLASRDSRPTSMDSRERRRLDAHWFVHLRWLAAAVALGLVACARPGARVLLLSWWAGLVAANLFFEVALRRWRGYEIQIVVQAVVDLIVLTGFLNASGGLENPLSTVFVFPVIVGRILLPPGKALVVTLLAMVMFSFMAFGEYFHLLPHYANAFFPHPEAAQPAGLGHGGHAPHDGAHAAYDLFFVLGRTAPFLLVLLLTDSFMAGVMRRLRNSEREMRRSVREAVMERERLEGVVDAAGVGMMQVDPGLSLLWFSRRIADWFSWGRDTVDATCPLFEVPGGCATCVTRASFESGETTSAERRDLGSSTGERFFRHTASPVRAPDGAVLQVVEVIENITDRRALEEEAVRAGKLSVLGRMAAGIAHEIGNPLSSISARLRLLERRHDEAFVAQSVDVLEDQIERISRIVRGVSHFARVRRRDRSAFGVNALVEEMVGVTELDRRARGIRFIRELEEPSPIVCGVRDQIGQILLNLLLNAVEASPQGGVVTVGSRLTGGEARISIADQGPGLDRDDRDRLFEPFFTTKPEGTGLGLPISLGFATAHGGTIEVDSRGSGSRFVLVLPQHQVGAPCGGSSGDSSSAEG